jgi:hypothetical protein
MTVWGAATIVKTKSLKSQQRRETDKQVEEEEKAKSPKRSREEGTITWRSVRLDTADESRTRSTVVPERVSIGWHPRTQTSIPACHQNMWH